jgi:hypothetical protein
LAALRASSTADFAFANASSAALSSLLFFAMMSFRIARAVSAAPLPQRPQFGTEAPVPSRDPACARRFGPARRGHPRSFAKRSASNPIASQSFGDQSKQGRGVSRSGR